MSMKYVCLSVLVLQTVSNVLLVRRTRHLNISIPVVVACQEIIKLLTCVLVVCYSEGVSHAVSDIKQYVIKDWLTTLKLGVPAVLYVIQNNLLFTSLANLDPATYQITYQLKILTTALFSIFLLKKKISKIQWLSLVILTIGVIFVQWRPESQDKTGENSLLGVACILMACFTSGFAGVFFEMMLKSGTNQSVWIRNIQLALCSFFVSICSIVATQQTHIAQFGLFHDFKFIVLAVILSQAYGGILIGLVVKYADNILKVFATSISIVLSCLIGIFYLQELNLTLTFSVGMCLVCSATLLYSSYPAEQAKPKAH